MFKWKKEYEVGIDFVDEQHQRLFEIGNMASNLNNDDFTDDKYDKIVSIINELEAYTKYHFTCEEEFLMKKGYRRLLSHKVQHDDFIQKFKEIDLDELDNQQNEHLNGILDFVAEWITQHILVMDRHYADSLKQA